MATTLVLGVGNVLLGDEGAGVRVVDYLSRHHPALPGVTCLDGGTLSFTLAPAIEDADNLIVVDAAELHGEPGLVRTFTGAEMDRFLGGARRSVHEVALIDLLDITRLTDSLPANRALVGIQPAEITWGDRLSQRVADGVPQAAAAVVELARAWHGRQPLE